MPGKRVKYMKGNVEDLVAGYADYVADFNKYAADGVRGDATHRLQSLFDVYEGDSGFNVILSSEETTIKKVIVFQFDPGSLDWTKETLVYVGFEGI